MSDIGAWCMLPLPAAGPVAFEPSELTRQSPDPPATFPLPFASSCCSCTAPVARSTDCSTALETPVRPACTDTSMGCTGTTPGNDSSRA